MKAQSPEQQFAGFIAKFEPDVVATARVALARLRKLLPGAVELVYDNYNALVIGFGPSERAGEAILSIGLYPRWVNLYFLQGAWLPDPQKLLRGSGKQVRNITLPDKAEAAAMLDSPAVRALIRHARLGTKPLPKTPRRMVIRAVSPKQRSRKPGKS